MTFTFQQIQSIIALLIAFNVPPATVQQVRSEISLPTIAQTAPVQTILPTPQPQPVIPAPQPQNPASPVATQTQPTNTPQPISTPAPIATSTPQPTPPSVAPVAMSAAPATTTPALTVSAGTRVPSKMMGLGNLDERFTITAPDEAITLDSVMFTINAPANVVSNVQVKSNGVPWGLGGGYDYYSNVALFPTKKWLAQSAGNIKNPYIDGVAIPAGGSIQVDVYMTATGSVNEPAVTVDGASGTDATGATVSI